MFRNNDMPEYKVVNIPEVEDDIDVLFDFYFDNNGEESAMRFDEAAETMISSLGTWPRAHQMWEDDDTIRRVNLPKHKVAIVYRIDDEYLEVIAVAAFHTLSNPEKATKLIERRVKMAEEWRRNHEKD